MKKNIHTLFFKKNINFALKIQKNQNKIPLLRQKVSKKRL